LLRVPFYILGPSVVMVAILGTYSLRTSWFDVGLLVLAGAVGYLFRKARLDAGPLVMAFILANLLDTSLRHSLLMGDGNPLILVSRPISACILAVSLVAIFAQVVATIRSRGAYEKARKVSP
ncbi:tripartite tricarboxylate transporter permease, partial [Bacillus cereus]|uniref:tripartite tricarboxylate transporter permease n=1 Tax=Bacillus cereus TaxID=1396 RepID=UPI003602F392